MGSVGGGGGRVTSTPGMKRSSPTDSTNHQVGPEQKLHHTLPLPHCLKKILHKILTSTKSDVILRHHLNIYDL